MKFSQISTTSGHTFEMEIPEPADHESFFVFAMHKSGSSLLDKMMIDACRSLRMPVLAPYTEAFNNGIRADTLNRSVETIIFRRGYAYLGFRFFFPLKINFDFSLVKKIFLIRDPRDMLTSLYFSLKYSHPVASKAGTQSDTMRSTRKELQTLDIDTFVLSRSHYYLNVINHYESNIFPRNVRTYRYEDVIFDKQNWLRDILTYLDLNLSIADVREIAKKNDVFPQVENQHAHIRQVIPGNYKVHLKPETIVKLNESFYDMLRKYDYEP